MSANKKTDVQRLGLDVAKTVSNVAAAKQTASEAKAKAQAKPSDKK